MKRQSKLADKLLLAFIVLFILALTINLPVLFWQTLNRDFSSITFDLMLQIFLFSLNLIVVGLIFILIAMAYASAKTLDDPESKMRIFINMLTRDPFSVFSEKAKREKDGTYKNPYNQYKDLHIYSKRTFRRTLALVFLQIIIVGLLLYNITNISQAFFLEQFFPDQKAGHFMLYDLEK